MSTINLTVKEKIAYGLGDTGCNFVWQTVMLFLAYYYTDVYGLSPIHMGTMFLLVRFIDAVTDPLMGSLVDRTRTKHGQFRPYILWMAVPFGVACMITFYTPDLGSTGKIIYAYCSYILLTLMYTAINVPYCAMANAMTNDPKQRVSLQSYRFGLSTAGGLVVALVALPLVDYIGQGDEQKGYLGAMIIMGIGAMLLFFYCFANTKEHHTTEPSEAKKGSTFSDVKLLWKNTQWRVLFILNIVLLTGIVLKAASTMYYVNSVMGRPDLATMMMVAGMLANIVGALASAPVLGRFDKIKTYKVLIGISGILSASMFFIGPTNIMLIFVVMIVLSVVQMSTTPLLWSMMSDVVDYEKSRSGRSLSGMVFSTNLFAIKAGIAVGGAMVGWILAGAGYVGGAELQSNQAITWINLLYTFIPGVFFISLVFVMHFYRLDENKLQLIKQQNEQAETKLQAQVV
ncbi:MULTISPECIES: glycoside-pentoside-hexuronide (GPH):cation symporter [unclassified Agarivorans]|uniref:glycoside-pentoside-hexuronide (GPH):cation symporter n=1 Tax=unclassified Agarivorans TaxID=2636026 RepID=UPI0026E42070|nr:MULTISPECIES: glycoside-pentoside-hexuronide (GPH):cation symporter [unclassified Agarivorans]MDO6687791.1 glycoside-pentoside-hexuronide (GPH):cation symporter [Agarivorans sp. 3_MG-2023]MDO6717345.1 glycoside-pentoside-hexuronide (GPH):cation symporter [Agarivorans sp. 2_MG-2023]